MNTVLIFSRRGIPERGGAIAATRATLASRGRTEAWDAAR